MSEMKWFYIAGAFVLGSIPVGDAVEKYSENMAKRDIIVACYNAGNKDCQNLWGTIK